MAKVTIDLTGDDDDVDELADSLATASLTPVQAPSNAAGVHASLGAMLRLGGLETVHATGDGNCAYHAACICLEAAHLRSLGLWRAPNEMRLQREVRGRVVDFLQRDESAHHRFVGATGTQPPPPSAMEAHRRDGVYAKTPQLRGLAEVLRCCMVSIDSARLFDRVPVFTCGRQQSLALRSWREIAPSLARGESLAEGMPTIVIVNNGQDGAGSHFDATRRTL